MVSVLYTKLATTDSAKFFHYLDTIPHNLQDRILNFHRLEDAQASLYGKLLLMEGLKLLMNLKLDIKDLHYDRFNRPYLNSSIDFNISHTEGLVVCIISDTHKVGIDVEKIKPIELRDFKTLFTVFEWAEIICAKDKYTTFYNFWTKKEAVIKAIGRGLNMVLESIPVNSNVACVEGQLWYLKEMVLGDFHVGHIASNGVIKSVVSLQRVF